MRDALRANDKGDRKNCEDIVAARGWIVLAWFGSLANLHWHHLLEYIKTTG